jgi:predicted transcriptional regulator
MFDIDDFVCFQRVMDRMKLVTKSNSNAELARNLGISPSTIGTWVSRQSFPYERCVQISIKHNVSLDWLVTGKEIIQKAQSTLTKDELKNSLMEGLFTAIQVRAMTAESGVKIGDIANILMTELQEKHKVIFNEKKDKVG